MLNTVRFSCTPGADRRHRRPYNARVGRVSDASRPPDADISLKSCGILNGECGLKSCTAREILRGHCVPQYTD